MDALQFNTLFAQQNESIYWALDPYGDPDTHCGLRQQAVLANAILEHATPRRILLWAWECFSPDITMACSFGTPTGMVLIDMASKLDLPFPVFYLDTDFLFPETHRLIEVARERYGIEPKSYRPRWTPRGQEAEFGAELWNSDPDLCCEVRRVEPNGRALEGKRAWITGLRDDRPSRRRRVAPIQWDAKFELIKVNPLAHWSEGEVWSYIRENDVPYNELHDQGYASVGCTACAHWTGTDGDTRSHSRARSGQARCNLYLAEDLRAVKR